MPPPADVPRSTPTRHPSHQNAPRRSSTSPGRHTIEPREDPNFEQLPGAALAGADRDLLTLCSAYALPLGEAFQLRDDLLGVFGDPALTGKPVLEDLHSGKATVLMALATRRATPEQRRTLDALVGRVDLGEEDAAYIRRILQHTGARDTGEAMITERYERALAALDSDLLAPPIIAALRQIAARAAIRTA